MLTKTDLKAIENILDTTLEKKLEFKLEEKLETKLSEKLKPVYKQLNKIEAKLDKTINHFDQSQTKIIRQVRIMQNHLSLPIMDFA